MRAGIIIPNLFSLRAPAAHRSQVNRPLRTAAFERIGSPKRTGEIPAHALTDEDTSGRFVGVGRPLRRRASRRVSRSVGHSGT